ncbi:uncharacterized protein MKZ38_005830 [Zalerion maritima]|uniref:Rhodopsin domain-containing protein n=1 Tax=Zalerion maritima TaxID=339359 RepID=A0AAD5WUP8_9PEZI|nr:uncharacterized protein MKZ38_005830 [Zalerion maritima]
MTDAAVSNIPPPLDLFTRFSSLASRCPASPERRTTDASESEFELIRRNFTHTPNSNPAVKRFSGLTEQLEGGGLIDRALSGCQGPGFFAHSVGPQGAKPNRNCSGDGNRDMDFSSTGVGRLAGRLRTREAAFVLTGVTTAEDYTSVSRTTGLNNPASGSIDWSQVDLSESLSGSAIACAITSAVLSCLFVAARFYTRARIVPKLGKEDWAILASWVFAVATSICLLVPGWLTIVFYSLSLWYTKVSIVLLYLRILTHQWAIVVSKTMLAIVVLFHVFVVGTALTACVPIQKFWDWSVDGHCHPDTVWWTNVYGNIISDFLISLTPLPIIFTINLPIRQKIGLCFVFLVGFFRVCIVSIIRVCLLNTVYPTADITYDNAVVAVWSCIEINTAIACACMTTLKPFVSKFLLKLLPGKKPRGPLQPPGPLTIGTKPIRGINRRLSRFGEPRSSPSSMSTADEDEVTLKDLEAQTNDHDDPNVHDPPRMYMRAGDAASSLSSDIISNLGPEIKPTSSFGGSR